MEGMMIKPTAAGVYRIDFYKIEIGILLKIKKKIRANNLRKIKLCITSDNNYGVPWSFLATLSA